jgi:alpha-galactosidase
MNLYRNLKRMTVSLIAVLIIPAVCVQWAGTYAAVSQTPPMGWNSFDMYNGLVNEEQVKAVADYMAEHLLEYGWEYVCVDYLWYSTSTDFWNYAQDADFNPALVYDENGRVQPDPEKIPSSEGGKGLKPLADYVHAPHEGSSAAGGCTGESGSTRHLI